MARKHRRIGRGLLAGLAGGLIASWTMNEFQALWSKASEALQERPRQPQQQAESQTESSEDATMKAADNVSRNLLDRPLSKEQKKKVGPIVHYAFVLQWAQCTASRRSCSRRSLLGGSVQVSVRLYLPLPMKLPPAFGLSGKPTEAPLSPHVYGLASHLVYGVTTEGVRRAAMAA